MREYRLWLFEQGEQTEGTDAEGGPLRKGFSQEAVLEVIRQRGRVPVADYGLVPYSPINERAASRYPIKTALTRAEPSDKVGKIANTPQNQISVASERQSRFYYQRLRCLSTSSHAIYQ